MKFEKRNSFRKKLDTAADDLLNAMNRGEVSALDEFERRWNTYIDRRGLLDRSEEELKEIYETHEEYSVRYLEEKHPNWSDLRVAKIIAGDKPTDQEISEHSDIVLENDDLII